MVTREKLKDYAAKLMFDMDDAGYERTLEEFETVEKHMALIGEIEGIEEGKNIIYKWIPIEEIPNAKIKPDYLKDKLIDIKDEFEFIEESDM